MLARLREKLTDRAFMTDVLVISILFLVYIFHAAQMGDWIMDDAGISFVYSRNLAQGNGLVSQPGREPVEGYSNPLWVFLLVPFFWLNLFDPLVTPKVISAFLILLSIVFLYWGSRRVLGSRIPAIIVCALMVANTSFAVWTISGMENSLYAFLAILMFWILVEQGDRKTLPLKLGILVGLAALTRPDGIMFALIYPLYLLIERGLEGDKSPQGWKALFIDLGRFILPVGVIFGGYLLFRLVYFHDILPNTYYAKGINTFQLKRWFRLITLHESRFDKIVQVIEMVLGRLAMLGLMLIVVSITHFMTARRFSAAQWVSLVMFVTGTLIFVMLPGDWMGENRFATPLIPFYYLLLVQLGQAWSGYLPIRPSWQQAIFGLFLIVFLGFNIDRHLRRTQNFAGAPPTPFAVVADAYGRRFDAYAAKLGLEDASVLLPDMGGTLYYSDLVVYDLGALIDPTIARTLRKDDEAFHEYVFEEIKPTFIEAYSGWADFAKFDDDPRFRRDYVAIYEEIDSNMLVFGVELYSGTYVRIDALVDLSQLELLR